MEIIDVLMRLRDGVSSQLQKIRNQMQMTANAQNTLGRNIEKTGRGISSIGETLMPVSAGIVAAGTLIGKTFIDFDATITRAGAKAGATADELEQMRQVAGKLGADFPISATQAAQAMDNLAASGYNANQIMAMMPSIVTSSVASGEDLAQTAQVVSSALNVWGLQTGNVEKNTLRVSDVIQQANNMSALSLQDFGLAMQYAGTPAANLNIQIEDLATAMAAMRNKGLEASQIGTSLRGLFQRLADPPKEAALAIQQLGLQVQDGNGNFVGMKSIVDQLRGSMSGLTNIQKTALAQALAGTEGYSGLLALLDTAPETYDEMTKAMYNASGSSQKQFEIMKHSLKGSIDDMLGSLESLAISLGDILKPVINDTASVIAGFADALNKLSPAQKQLIIDIAGGIVAFTGFSLVAGKVVSAGGSIIRMWADVRKVLAGGTVSDKLLQYTVQGAKGAIPTLKNLGSTASEAFKTLRAASFADVGASMAGGAKSAAGGMANGVKNAMTGVVNGIKGISLSGIGNGVSKVFTGIASGIRSVAMAGRFLVASPLGLAIMAIAGAAYILYKNWDKVGPFFTKLWNTITQAFSNAWNMIGPALDRLISAFSRLFNQASSGQGALGKLFAVFGTLAEILGGALLVALQAVLGIFTSVFSGVVVVVGSAVGMIINVLAGVITFISDVFIGDWQGAWEAVKGIFESIVEGISGIFQGVCDAIKGAINSIISSVNSISVDIPGWVPGYGGQHFSMNIPMLAHGTDDWYGGPAMVHDKGAEIIDLPNHSRVIPHDKSLMTAFNMGANSGSNNITVTIANATIGTVQEAKALARTVAEEIEYELRKRSINRKVGAV